MVNNCLARLTVARDDVDHTRRNTSLERNFGKQQRR